MLITPRLHLSLFILALRLQMIVSGPAYTQPVVGRLVSKSAVSKLVSTETTTVEG